MSFHFLPWTEWDNKDLIDKLKVHITKELNAAPPNPLLKAPLRATELSFGSKTPSVKLDNIVKCSLDEIELIFSFAYDGDGYIKIESMAQINKLAPVRPSFVSFSNLTGNSLMSQKPLVMPLEFVICDLIISGKLMVRLERVSKGSLKEWKLSVQLLSNPLKQLVVNNNFQETFPPTKKMFTDLIYEQATKAIVELMDNPKLIDIDFNKNKAEEEKREEGSLTVTTTDLNPKKI